MENMEGIIMEIILHSGDARSSAMEGIAAAKEGDITKAKGLIETARGEVGEAHHVQTSLIQKEAGGEKVEMSLLMCHAQDHLMTSMVVIDLADEIIALHAKIG